MFFTCAAFVIYGRYFEQPFLYYQNLPFPPIFRIVTVGSLVPLEVERCSRSDKKETYTTTRRQVHLPKEGETKLPDIILESKDVDILPGCHRELSKLNTASPFTPPGTWMFTGTALVPGLIRTHEIQWYSEPVEVTAKPRIAQP